MHIPIDAALVGRLVGSCATASLCLLRGTGAGARKGGGGGGIRILKTENTSTHAPRKIRKKTEKENESVNKPLYYFLLYNSGGRKFRCPLSRNLWRAD